MCSTRLQSGPLLVRGKYVILLVIEVAHPWTIPIHCLVTMRDRQYTCISIVRLHGCGYMYVCMNMYSHTYMHCMYTCLFVCVGVCVRVCYLLTYLKTFTLFALWWGLWFMSLEVKIRLSYCPLYVRLCFKTFSLKDCTRLWMKLEVGWLQAWSSSFSREIVLFAFMFSQLCNTKSGTYANIAQFCLWLVHNTSLRCYLLFVCFSSR